MTLKQLIHVSLQVSNINQRISCAQFQTSVKELKQLDDVVRTEFIPAITGGLTVLI